MQKPWHFILFFALCIVVGASLGMAVAGRLPHINTSSIGKKISKKEPYQPVTLTFVGDIMIDRGVASSIKKNFKEDYGQFFEPLRNSLSASDITFANLEGPVTDQGEDAGSKFSFQMNPDVLPALKDAGFDIVSFANNHVGDRSITGFRDTLARLNESGLPYAGAGLTKAEASAPRIITVRGRKIGFIAMSDVGPNWIKATDAGPGILLMSDPNLETIIKDAAAQVDVLIVSVHWGEEYSPRTERQVSFAHHMVDWGADAVIGHHPHVIQATEEYNGKFIAYSLGNFVFDQYFSAETMRGLMIDMTVDETNSISISQHVVDLSKQYQPIIVRDPVPEDYVTQVKKVVSKCPAPADPDQEDLWLVPVGPDRSVGTYVPANLVRLNGFVTTSSETHCYNKSAAAALASMEAAMGKLNLSVIVSSAYRSATYQHGLHTASEATRDPKKRPYPSVAIAGHSEHQLGMAVDLVAKPDYKLEGFASTPEYAWLKEHSWEYGFIQSYPAGKESVTGYTAESWHYRYVGLANALAIHNLGTTTYEYLKNPQ